MLGGGFFVHGHLHENERGEIEAWYGHSWSEGRDYISLYINWVTANRYSFLKTFKTTNGQSFRSHGPFFIILTPFESQFKILFTDIISVILLLKDSFRIRVTVIVWFCLGFRIRVIIGNGITGPVVIFLINDFSSTQKFKTVRNKRFFKTRNWKLLSRKVRSKIGKNKVGKFEPKLKNI